ncbi:MAG: hypothetical protein ACLR1T_10010 [Evtepia gabavorous]
MSAMAGSVEELLDLLYTEIEEAKNAPLNNDRCVIERDRVLDMIDDVKAELPVEIKRAKDLVANRNDYIASAKREADSLRQQAEDYAKRLVNEDAIVREAEKKADEILSDAEEQCRMLKAAASEYCEDTLRRMEEAVADAYDRCEALRAKFRSALSAASAGRPSEVSRHPAGPCMTLRPMRTRIELKRDHPPLVSFLRLEESGLRREPRCR